MTKTQTIYQLTITSFFKRCKIDKSLKRSPALKARLSKPRLPEPTTVLRPKSTKTPSTPKASTKSSLTPKTNTAPPRTQPKTKAPVSKPATRPTKTTATAKASPKAQQPPASRDLVSRTLSASTSPRFHYDLDKQPTFNVLFPATSPPKILFRSGNPTASKEEFSTLLNSRIRAAHSVLTREGVKCVKLPRSFVASQIHLIQRALLTLPDAKRQLKKMSPKKKKTPLPAQPAKSHDKVEFVPPATPASPATPTTQPPATQESDLRGPVRETIRQLKSKVIKARALNEVIEFSPPRPARSELLTSFNSIPEFATLYRQVVPALVTENEFLTATGYLDQSARYNPAVVFFHPKSTSSDERSATDKLVPLLEDLIAIY